MAEWWRRLVAFALDLAILAIPNSIIVSVIAGGAATNASATHVASMGPRLWEAVGVALVVSIGYFSFLDGGGGGQTVGKMAIGVAVRDEETGGPIGAGRALARRAFFFATYLGFGVLFVVNALSPLWDPRRRAWHDKVVGSCVVSVR
ncbi:MAG TPA: RDD family protein [Acidimicrobiales bacterium]|nr:RDD family protein [Acidimicrobiales bacterium]